MIFIKKYKLSDFGISCQVELIKRNETQEWLIKKIKERTGSDSFDSSYLNRIMTGRVYDSKYIPVIKEVLNLNT